MDNQTETGMSLMPSKTAGKNIMQQNVVNIVSWEKNLHFRQNIGVKVNSLFQSNVYIN